MSTTHDTAHAGTEAYYTPPPSRWPAIGSLALLALTSGFILILAKQAGGPWVLAVGAGLLIWMLGGWFGTVIRENEAGLTDGAVDTSFRWGMVWFIFSEVMFFASFFGALYYARSIAQPLLAEAQLLWPGYRSTWPTLGPGLPGTLTTVSPWGIPALNTLILLSSGVTVTWAHWGLLAGRRWQLKAGLAATIALGVIFLGLQAYEYVVAPFSMKSGIYGTTFFMLTGFHGLHVTLGAIMLTVIFGRALAGHFHPHQHFAFEAVAWYWHFVDVVWLLLFVFVYWL